MFVQLRLASRWPLFVAVGVNRLPASRRAKGAVAGA
jgi:hypothetical protein